jgi:hypothetical protein
MPLNCFKDVTMHIVLDMYPTWSLILVPYCDAHASKVSTLTSEPEGGGIIQIWRINMPQPRSNHLFRQPRCLCRIGKVA